MSKSQYPEAEVAGNFDTGDDFNCSDNLGEFTGDDHFQAWFTQLVAFDSSHETAAAEMARAYDDVNSWNDLPNLTVPVSPPDGFLPSPSDKLSFLPMQIPFDMPHQGSSSTWANHDQHTTNFELSQGHPNEVIKLDKPKDDGYNWKKYGQKLTKEGVYWSYYKCTHRRCHPVKKRVQSTVAGHVTEVIYMGHHNHPSPQLVQRDTSTQNREILDSVDTCTTLKEEEEKVARAQRTFEAVMSNGRVTKDKIVVLTRSDIDVLDDGYRWQKYGQKPIKGNPNPRSYYKCTTKGCEIRKRVERSSKEPSEVITTYEGKHTHNVSLVNGRIARSQL